MNLQCLSHSMPTKIIMSNSTDIIETNHSETEIYYETEEEKNSRLIHVVLRPILIILGTVGNVLSLWIMRSRSLRNISTCFFLSALAIADTGYLWTGALPYWVGYLTEWQVNPELWGNCLPVWFGYYFFEHVSAWLLTTMTVERCIAVWFPFSAKKVCTVRNAKLAIAVVITIFLIFDIQWFFIVEISPDGDSYVCQKNVATWYEENFDLIDAFLYSFAPFIILTTANVLICVKMLKRKKVIAPGTHGQLVNQKAQRGTFMLLSASFLFCVCTAPVSAYYMITYQIPPMTEALLINLGYLNHGINFVLYVISGTKFRSEFKRKFCCREDVMSQGSVTVSTVGSGSRNIQSCAVP